MTDDRRGCDDDRHGAFKYFDLCMSVASERPPEPLRSGTPEARCDNALARYAWIHERRHFHDCFGTDAGVLLFLARVKMLRCALPLLSLNGRTEAAVSLPYPQWMAKTLGGAAQEAFSRSWRLYERAARRFMGDLRPIVESSSHPNDLVVTTRYPTGEETTSFPFTFGVAEGRSMHTLHRPIGLRTLMEGNARALERSAIEIEFGRDVAEVLQRRAPQRASVEVSEVGAHLAANCPPANVTDFMIGKHLKLAGRRGKFERDAVLAVADITMSNARFRLVGQDQFGLPTGVECTDLGQQEAKVVQTFGLSELEAGTTHQWDFPEESKKKLLGSLSGTLLTHPVSSPARDFGTALNIVEAIVADHIVRPLQRARVASDHAVFRSGVGYLSALATLPPPPVLETPGKVVFADYMCDLSIDAWAKYVMLGHTVEQLFAGEKTVRCPRRDGLVGELGQLPFFEGGCRGEIAAETCGAWHSGPMRPLPSCAFAATLRAAGFPVEARA